MKLEGSDIPGAETASSEADSLLRAIARTDSVRPFEAIGAVFSGRYRVVELLGRGGMGRVYAADDIELERRVALKIVLPSADRDARVRRFLRERSLTAGLEHPSIVPVYDCGVAPSGDPFYVMRIAHGEPLDRLLAKASALDERIALLPNVIATADAVAFAHTHGIVHRDLKPANILVGAFGETLVADWGLAKRLDSDDGERDASTSDDATPPRVANETRTGAVLGTPAYMAPEQAAGRPVDARADVYAVGAILHHLLTGRPKPVGDKTSRAGKPASDAHADLLAITAKALAPAPEDRYASMRDLSDELRRVQTGQLVGARSYTRAQLLRRWLKRNRTIVATASTLALVIVAIAVASGVRIVRERNNALAQRAEAETARKDASDRGDALIILQARAELTRDPTASLAWLKRYPRAGDEWVTAARIAADAQSRGVARHVWELGEPASAVTFTPEGREIVVATAHGLTWIDLATGRRRTATTDGTVGDILVFSPDGSRILTAGNDGARIWDARTGAVRRVGVAGPTAPRFSPDGAFLQMRQLTGVTLWRLDAEGAVEVHHGRSPRALTRHHDRVGMITDTNDELALVDVISGETIARTPLKQKPYDVQVSADGAVVAASLNDALLVWEPATGVVRRIAVGRDLVHVLFPAPSGHRFVSCGAHASTELWLHDADRGTARVISTGERCTRQGITFSPEGDRLLSTGYSAELRVTDIATARTRRLLGHETGVNDAELSRDGKWIASVSSDGSARLWRVGDGDRRVVADMSVLDAAADSGVMVLADRGTGAASIIDASGERHGLREASASPRGPSANAAWVSADGRLVVFVEDGALVAFDVPTRMKRVVTRERELVDAFATGDHSVSLDGTALVEASEDGAVRLVDLATGRGELLTKLADRAFSVSWSDDGTRIAAGGRDGSAHVFDVRTKRDIGELRGPGWVWSVALRPDGNAIVAAYTDGVIRIKDLATNAVTELRGHVGTASRARFTTDGREVVSAGSDGTIRWWSLATGLDYVAQRETDEIIGLALAPDSSAVFHRTQARARIWSPGILPPRNGNADDILAWLDRTTSATVDAKGHVASRQATP